MPAQTPLETPAPNACGTRFVLLHTRHAGNVGAAARAMKVMGFADLVLVAPRLPDVRTHEDAVAMASGATDLLASARIVDTIGEALDGITHACATAMTPRDFGPPTAAPRPHLADIAPQVLAGHERVAFVFGNERYGMANEDVWRCHQCLSIPAHPEHGSLNLAQAVQVIAYEWRQALGAWPVVARTAEPPRATIDQVDGALAHWQEVLVAIGFLDPAVPKKLMPRLQQLLHRAQPTAEEIHILRGMARAVAQSRRGG